jgi:hypothetical protein
VVAAVVPEKQELLNHAVVPEDPVLSSCPTVQT